jgi:predicted CoA-substrate-specific enzyme activase
MITAGIDVGSTTTKSVLLENERVLGQAIILSDSIPSKSASDVFEKCCGETGIGKSQIDAIAITGYGRRLAGFGDMVITEIKACGLGAINTPSPLGRIFTIVDVGGQDTKVISLDENGGVEDFAMNDKCAAGTGRFLEMLAHKLDLTYEKFVEASLKSTNMIQMNSTCAVFAESEVVSLLARGIDKTDIAAAANNSIADRICSMIRRVGSKEVICFAGGGARNGALVKAVEENMNMRIFVPEHAQTVVALGAAIAARDRIAGKSRSND